MTKWLFPLNHHNLHNILTTTSMFILVVFSRIGIINTATLKLGFQLFQLTVNFIFLE